MEVLVMCLLVLRLFPPVHASIIPLRHTHHTVNFRSQFNHSAHMRRPLQLISQLDLNTTSSNTPSTMPAPVVTQRKYVVAHHMVGNTYPYTLTDWLDDIALASAAGIDGFALNMGRDVWQTSRVADAYNAALQSKLDFKLFISLDMSSFSCSSPQDAQVLRDIVRPYLSHPCQLQYASRALVSTFSGESCTFGQGNAAEGWRNQFVSHPDLIGRLYFVPSFFIDPKSFGEFHDVINGDFAWNTGWPIQLTSSSVQSLISDISSGSITSPLKGIGIVRRLWNSASSVQVQVQTLLAKYIGSMVDDKAHLDALAALDSGATTITHQRRGENEHRAYMAPVSPWFFTHYGTDSYNKNFVYLSDYWLYLKRWDSLIAARDQVDFVELISWNDYGESHYVGPIKGAQPNSQAWTDGFDHTAWLNITRYYSAAFKSGSYPPIEMDQIYMWARPHPANASASDDPVGPPGNGDLFQDAVWVMVMTTRNSTVVLCTDPNLSSDQRSTFNVPAGVSRLSIPIKPGGIMYGAILHENQTVVELRPRQFVFNASPIQYNFNVFIAGAQVSSQN